MKTYAEMTFAEAVDTYDDICKAADYILANGGNDVTNLHSEAVKIAKFLPDDVMTQICIKYNLERFGY